MPSFDVRFFREVARNLELVRTGESARIPIIGSPKHIKLKNLQIQEIYEKAYLNIFIAWELFLEKSFLAYLCGKASSRHGCVTLKRRSSFCKTMTEAETVMLTDKNGDLNEYFLWSNLKNVLSLVKYHLDGSDPRYVRPHYKTIKANFNRLVAFGAVRHRMAHHQRNTIIKFHAATRLLATKMFPSAKPGEFLQSWDTRTMPHVRWIESIANELKAMATAII